MEKQDFERIYEQWREQRIDSFEALELLLREADGLAVDNEPLLFALFKIQDIVTAMRGKNGKMFLAQGVTDATLKDEYKPKPDSDL